MHELRATDWFLNRPKGSKTQYIIPLQNCIAYIEARFSCYLITILIVLLIINYRGVRWENILLHFKPFKIFLTSRDHYLLLLEKNTVSELNFLIPFPKDDFTMNQQQLFLKVGHCYSNQWAVWYTPSHNDLLSSLC